MINRITLCKAAVVMMAAIALLWTSCYNAKKAQQQVDKAILIHPEVAAKELRKAFPCVPTTNNVSHDSTGYKNLIDSIAALNDFYGELLANIEPTTVVDTLEVNDSVKVLKLLNNINGFRKEREGFKSQIKRLNSVIAAFEPIHDTIPIKDISDNKVYEDRVKELNNALEKYRNRSDKRGTIIMWETAAVGVLLLLCVLFWKFRRQTAAAKKAIN